MSCHSRINSHIPRRWMADRLATMRSGSAFPTVFLWSAIRPSLSLLDLTRREHRSAYRSSAPDLAIIVCLKLPRLWNQCSPPIRKHADLCQTSRLFHKPPFLCRQLQRSSQVRPRSSVVNNMGIDNSYWKCIGNMAPGNTIRPCQYCVCDLIW